MRLLLAEARRVRPSPERLSIGTMLEVPALMWQLDELLREVDFVSVGSNDLLQFLFAADRGTPALFSRYDLLSQPVLRLLEQLLKAARRGQGRRRRAGVAVRRGGVAAVGGDGIGRSGLWHAVDAGVGHLAGEGIAGGTRPRRVPPVLAAIRGNASGAASLREPISVWAREQGLAFYTCEITIYFRLSDCNDNSTAPANRCTLAA